MRAIISVIKLTLFVFFTVAGSLTYLGILLCIHIIRLPDEPWKNRFLSFWAKGTAIIFRMKVITRGKAPSPPFFLVSNHLSYLDIIPIFLNLNCTFVAKKEVKHWPLLGFMVKMVGVIFIDRKLKKDVIRVNRLLNDAFNQYQGIVVFPEGTSSGGQDILKFRPPLLEFPAAEELPVHYASIHYETSESDDEAVNSVCFFGARDTFLSHLFKMAKNRKIICTIHISEDTVISNNRKELAILLQNKTEQIFVPTS